MSRHVLIAFKMTHRPRLLWGAFSSYFLVSVVAILDVTLVIDKPFVEFNQEATLKCVSENRYFNEEEFPFSVKVDIGTGVNLTKNREYKSIEPQDWPGKQLTILPSAGPSKFGFISCTVRDNQTDDTTKVTGIITSQRAVLVPTQLNYRTSTNESVTLIVLQPRWRRIGDLFWFRVGDNNTAEKVTQATLRLPIEQPSTSDAGSYMIFYQSRDRTIRIFQQALTRLIVRDCVKDRFGDDCLLVCPSCENGGVCDDKAGTCICPPGFMGRSCEIACGRNKFGGQCQYLCTEEDDLAACKNKLFCLPDPYGCSCGTGYAGISCSYDCIAGMYGADCSQSCHCIADQCNQFTGNCTIGCSEGWTGSYCRTPCINGTYGVDCNETCGFCSGDSASCDRFTGSCAESQLNDTSSIGIEMGVNKSFCLFGFRPPICKEACLNGTWGLDCRKACHCLNNTACDVRTGFCVHSIDDVSGETSCEDGWRGDACNETCEEGFYGEKCAVKCGRCKAEEPCDHITGTCLSTRGECDPGYKGWKCDKECSMGFFGARCAYVCNCANGTGCDVETGGCDGFCQAGFTGKNCHEQCPYGTYGLNCSQECGHCAQTSRRQRIPLCNLRNGKCTAGCTKAWSGDQCLEGILCDQNPCSNGGTCVQSGDYYSCKCSILYEGAHCEIKKPPCSSSPCLNNGNCTDINLSNYTCFCPDQYEGDNCEIDTAKIDEKPELNKKDDVIDDNNDSNYSDVDDIKDDTNENDDTNDNDDTNKNDDINNPSKKPDSFNDSTLLIIVAMCLGALLTIVLITFAYKVCFKPQSSTIKPIPIAPQNPSPVASIAEQKLRPNQIKSQFRKLTPNSTPSPSPRLTFITRSLPVTDLSEIGIESEHNKTSPHFEVEDASNVCMEQYSNQNIIETTKQHPDEQLRASASASPRPLTMSGSREGSPPFTQTSINTSPEGKLFDSMQTENEADVLINPLTSRKNFEFPTPPKPPSGPPDKLSVQPITSNQKGGLSRRKVRLRFSRNSPDHFDEISCQNFKRNTQNLHNNENLRSKKLESVPSKKRRNESLTLNPWKSSGKISPAPLIYGVNPRDMNLLVTSPRNADEEFEMESRKGPMTERKNRAELMLVKTKQT